MKKLICKLLLLWCICSTLLPYNELYAIPAYPKSVVVTQADGSTLKIKIFGDEFFNWKTTEDGYTIDFKDGFYYYTQYNSKGESVLSNIKVNDRIRGLVAPSSLSSSFNADRVAMMAPNLATKNRASRVGEAQRVNFPNKGGIKSIVLLVNFTDVKFRIADPKNAFYDMLNKPGYNDNYAVGSARDYFYDNSNGTFEPEFIVVGPIELDREMAYYGANTTDGEVRARDMIDEACLKASEQGVNFADYDYNNDGVIDNVFVFYAGYNEAESGNANNIWPHRWESRTKPTINGKRLVGYACSSELKGSSGRIMAGIGTFCHEFGHVFGLYDLYDTDYAGSGGNAYGFGTYSIMSSGGYNEGGTVPPLYTALERMDIGWDEPIKLNKTQSLTLKPIISGEFYKVDTDVSGEYFLVEFRSKSPQVSKWDTSIPGEGVLISHIDRSTERMDYWTSNIVNVEPSHENACVVKANNILYPQGTYQESGVVWPGNTNNTRFGSSSKPRAESWSGNYLGMNFERISVASDGKTASLDVVIPTETTIEGVVTSRLGTPLAGVNVSLIVNQKSSNTNDTKEVYGKILSNASGYIYSGVTDKDGKYSIKVKNDGEYIITANLNGYSPYATSIDLCIGQNYHNIIMTTVDESNYVKMSYSNGNLYTTLNTRYFKDNVVCVNKYSASDLRGLVGYELRQLTFYIGSNRTDAEVVVYNNFSYSPWFGGPTPVYVQKIDRSTLVENSYNTVEIESGKFTLPANGNTVWIGIRYSNFNYPDEEGNNFVIGIDDDASRKYHNTANLMYVDNASMITVYDFSYGGFTGNFLMDAYFNDPGDLVSISSIELNEGAGEINTRINASGTISYKILPENSTSKFIDWSSNDPDVVSINATTGKYTALREGSAIITAKAAYGDAKATIKINVHKGNPAFLKGVVTDSQTKAPIEGAIVSIEPIVPSLSAPSIKVSSGASFIGSYNDGAEKAEKFNVITNEKGEFVAEGLQDIRYYVNLTHEAYKTSEWNAITLQEGENSKDYTMVREPRYDAAKVTYSTEVAPDIQLIAMGGGADYLTWGVVYTADMLKDYVGYKVGSLDFRDFLTQKGERVYWKLFYDDDLSTPIFEGSTAWNGACLLTERTTIIDFDSINDFFTGKFDITVPNDRGLRFEFTTKAAIGLDISTPMHPSGKSNLIMRDGVWTTTDKLSSSWKGNWAVKLYLYESEPINPTSIEIKKIEGDDVLKVGGKMRLGLNVTPRSASYVNASWTSSNPSCVTVDNKGNVVGVNPTAEGEEVIITAVSEKSTEENPITAEYKLAVLLEQTIWGSVTDMNNTPIAGAKLVFTKIDPVITKSNAFSVVSYKLSEVNTKAMDSYMVVTDEKGEYKLDDIPVSNYRVDVFTKEGVKLTRTVTNVVLGLNQLDVKVSLEETNGISSLKWFDDVNGLSGVGAQGVGFGAYTRWTKDNLKDYVGGKFVKIQFHTRNVANAVPVIYKKANAYDDPQKVYEGEEFVTKAGWNIIEIPSDKQVLIDDATAEYYVGYQLNSYNSAEFPATIDMTNFVEGGNGSVLEQNGSWTNLSEVGFNQGNWLIIAGVESNSSQTQFSITPSQTSAYLSWIPKEYTKYKVAWGLSNLPTDKYENIEVEGINCMLTSLEANREYTAMVYGLVDNQEPALLYSKKFQTIRKVTNIPNIVLPDYEYKKDSFIALQNYNIEEGDIVKWFVNDKEVEDPDNLYLSVRGTYVIKCEITRKDKSFVIKREISVK